MISSRPYMRDLNGDHQRFTVVGWSVITLVAVFIAQNVGLFVFKTNVVTNWLSSSPSLLVGGQVWRALTYALLHDTDSILHIGFNVLMLLAVGRSALDDAGTRRWLWIVAVCSVAGALAHAAFSIPLGHDFPLVGASAAIYGLIGFNATLHPDREVGFFIIRTTESRLAWVFAGISVFGMLVWELTGATSLAHSAHVGGIAMGYAIARFNWFSEPFRWSSVELPAWWKRRKALRPITSNYTVNIGSETAPAAEAPSADLKARVDRILDKINEQGFQSLSAEERRLLEEAKDLLSRR